MFSTGDSSGRSPKCATFEAMMRCQPLRSDCAAPPQVRPGKAKRFGRAMLCGVALGSVLSCTKGLPIEPGPRTLRAGQELRFLPRVVESGRALDMGTTRRAG